MALQIDYWHRKDNADRNDLAFAALQVCRVWRGRDDVTSSRLFWQGWNDLTIVTEGEPTFRNFNPQADMAKATIALADLADPTAHHFMAEAKLGHEAFERAQGA